MKRSTQGHYVTISTVGEMAQAFVPSPLPPDPPIEWTPELRGKFDEAMLWLGRLDSVSAFLPEASLFLYSYVRKEAALSSQIEGTQSSLSDLLLFELNEKPGVPVGDAQEVSNYVAAMEYGLKRLADGFPLCLRLFREIHGILLSHGRGSGKMPGEFRTSQNWIGGSRPGNAAHVPPPAHKVPECMGKLELFLHDEPVWTPTLVKAALAHVQFETIHPFLDGNGRVGRLLITLLLCERKILRQPMLYLSLYFKTHRDYYYELLRRVRREGDWEAWLDFFAEAVIETSKQAVETAERLEALSKRDKAKIQTLGRASLSAAQVHGVLMEHPIATVKEMRERTKLSEPTVNRSFSLLEKLGIVENLTRQKRNRVFSYSAYIDILNRGVGE